MEASSLFARFLADGEGEDHVGTHIEYNDLYASIIFLAAIYAAGVCFSKVLKMPALVGEICCGILLGPNFLQFVPNVEAFLMLGEIGLILLVLEAGIDIDLTTLKLIGSRGVAIAVIGTFLPVFSKSRPCTNSLNRRIPNLPSTHVLSAP
jgi:membrane-bound ClpP family serine protease